MHQGVHQSRDGAAINVEQLFSRDQSLQSSSSVVRPCTFHHGWTLCNPNVKNSASQFSMGPAALVCKNDDAMPAQYEAAAVDSRLAQFHHTCKSWLGSHASTLVPHIGTDGLDWLSFLQALQLSEWCQGVIAQQLNQSSNSKKPHSWHKLVHQDINISCYLPRGSSTP